jgi:hypothetical protein
MYSFTHSQARRRVAALDHEMLPQKASTLHQQCSDIPSRPPPSCTSDQRRYNNLLQSVQTAAATVEWTSGPVSVQSAWVVDKGRRGGDYSWSRVVGWASGRRQQGKKTLKAKGASKSCCLRVDLWSSRIEKRATHSLSHPHCKAGWSGKLVHLPGPYGPTFWNFNLLQYEHYTRHNGPVACCSVGGSGWGGGRGGVAYRSRFLVYICGPCCFCYAAAHLGV